MIELAKGDVAAGQSVFRRRRAALLLDAARADAACSIDSPAPWATLDELLLIRSIAIDPIFVDVPLRHGPAVPRRPWAAAVGVAFVFSRRASRASYASVVDFSSKNVPLSAGQEPQHRRAQPLVFPGHSDRRPAARAVLPAASHRRLHDRVDRPAGAWRCGRAPVDAAAFAVSGVLPAAVDRDQLVCRADGHGSAAMLFEVARRRLRARGIRRGHHPRDRRRDAAGRSASPSSTRSATSIAAARRRVLTVELNELAVHDFCG